MGKFQTAIILFISLLLFQNFIVRESTDGFQSELISMDSAGSAQLLGYPVNESSHDFESVVSAPYLFPARVYDPVSKEEKDYIYLLNRKKSQINGMNISLRRKLETDKNFPGKLREFDHVQEYLVSKSGSNLGHHAIAFKGKIHLVYKKKFVDGRKENRLEIFDLACLSKESNSEMCLSNVVDPANVSGFAGRPGDTFVLARVTSNRLDTSRGKKEYFDTYKGRVVAVYECRSMEFNEKWLAPCTHGNGVFMQEYYFDEITNKVSLGKPIKIFKFNIVSAYDLGGWNASNKSEFFSQLKAGKLRDEKGGIVLNHYPQNLNVSPIGGNAIVFSFLYNSYEDENRQVTRDFPTHANLIVFDKVTRALNQVEKREDLVLDWSDRSYQSDRDLVDYSLLRSDSPWDQASFWTVDVFAHPRFLDRTFLFYESWGESQNQSEETKNTTYPGSKTKFLYKGKDDSSLEMSCHSYCKSDTLHGVKCLSIENLGGSKHGEEYTNWQRSQSMISQMDSKSVGVAIQCADIGTLEDGDDNLAVFKVEIDKKESKEVKQYGHDLCTSRGYAGFSYMEFKNTNRIDQVTSRAIDGKIVDESLENTFKVGEVYGVVCSKKSSTGSFKQIAVNNLTRSCFQECKDLGANEAHGMRPYKSEVIRAVGTNSGNGLMTYVNGGHLMTKELHNGAGRNKYWKNYWITDSNSVTTNSGEAVNDFKLRCICGPGQSLDGKMVYRTIEN